VGIVSNAEAQAAAEAAGMDLVMMAEKKKEKLWILNKYYYI
jgi:translation initiation factor IF-3